VFLFVAVEILARTVWPQGWSWILLRWAGLLPVAGVAAFVSYRHLSALLAHYGEDTIVTIVGPLAVDGLMIMATGALIAGKRAALMAVDADVAPEPALVPAQAVTTPVAPVTTPASPAVAAVPSVTVPPRATSTPAPPRARQDPTPRATPSPRPAPTRASTPASTDTNVAAKAQGPRASGAETGLLTRARHVADGHQRGTGRSITPGELAVRLRIGTERAQLLLAELEKGKDPTQGSATALNGTPVETAAR
jgi:hypothetical protein